MSSPNQSQNQCQMDQDNQPQQKQPQPQKDLFDNQQQEQFLAQISKSTQTLAKIKSIKKDKLCIYKKKYRQLNSLFCLMSQFFVNKKKKTNLQKKVQKYNRIQRRNNTLMNKIKKLQNSNQDNPSQVAIDQQLDQCSDNKNLPQIINNRNSKCYICFKIYEQIDQFYPQHCPQCASFGKLKRHQSANLHGMTALVTGARIKIGYQITLKLLRDGATVYATTRFPQDALIRYQKQPDFSQFKDRLFLIQCDFLSSMQVQQLIKYIKSQVKHLDILIHNAAQTITRPPQFYTFQLQNQYKQLSQIPKNIITFSNKCYPSIQIQKQMTIESQKRQTSSIDLTRVDQFNQPLDTRLKNTWKQKIQDVSLIDCMSTQVINSTIPFYINGQLRCIMGGQHPSWIINVSSMQGVFSRRFKTCYHPHTNMAKASLNMMTRTCAQQMSKHKIYMSSVDTGWVTNQNPYNIAFRMQTSHNFITPLDCLQGAMRVLDPVYQGVRDNRYIYGKFLKNYHQSQW